MPPRHLDSVTILNGQSNGPIIDLRSRPYIGLAGLAIYAPSTLPETVTVHAAPDPAGVFRALQSDGVDVTLPAGKVTVVHPVSDVGALRFVASVAVAADRTFDLSGGEPEPT